MILKKILYSFAIVLFVFAGILMATNTTFAQTDDGLTPDITVSEEATQDNRVTTEDLGAEKARILPDSAFFGFKTFGRSIKEAFTFDPVEKAELRLKHANQEMAEAQQLVEEKSGDPEALSDAADAVAKATGRIDNIRKQAEDLKQRKGLDKSTDKSIDNIVENVLDSQIKHQKIFDRIENQIDEKATGKTTTNTMDAINQAREQAADAAGGVLTGIEDDADRVAEKINAVLKRQKGSEFKDFKNVEVLLRIEEKVPESAREAIRMAQKNAMDRFHSRLEQSTVQADDVADRFIRYAGQIHGDAALMFQASDEIKQRLDNPEIAQKFEQAKDIFAQNFQRRIEYNERFEDERFKDRMRERMFNGFSGNEVEKLRVMGDLQGRMAIEDQQMRERMEKEMNKHEEKTIAQFKEKFNDPNSKEVVKEFELLRAKALQNPDPALFKAMDTLKDRLGEKQQAFVNQMEAEAQAHFSKRAREEGDNFFKRISTSVPEDVEVFRNLQDRFQQPMDMPYGEDYGSQFGPMPGGPDFGPMPYGPGGPGFSPLPSNFFDRAMNAQTDGLQQQLRYLDDPNASNNFLRRFDNAPDFVIDEIKRREGGFEDLFNEKQRFVEEDKLRKMEESARMKNDEDRMRIDREFKAKMQNAKSEEDYALIEKERIDKEREFDNKMLEERKDMFQERMKFNPFCDEACQKQEVNFFEKRIEEQKGEMEKMREFDMEQRQMFEQFRPEMRDQDGMFNDDKRDNRYEEESMPYNPMMNDEPMQRDFDQQKQDREPMPYEPKSFDDRMFDGGQMMDNNQEPMKYDEPMQFEPKQYEPTKYDQPMNNNYNDYNNSPPPTNMYNPEPEPMQHEPEPMQYNEPQQFETKQYEPAPMNNPEPMQMHEQAPMQGPMPGPGGGPEPMFMDQPQTQGTSFWKMITSWLGQYTERAKAGRY